MAMLLQVGGRKYVGIGHPHLQTSAGAPCIATIWTTYAGFVMALDNPTVALDEFKKFVRMEQDDTPVIHVRVYEKLIDIKP